MNRFFSISKLRLGKRKNEKPSYSQYRPCTEHIKVPKMTKAELEERVMKTLQEALQYGQTLGVKKTVELDPRILEPLIQTLSNGTIPICDQSSDNSKSKPEDTGVIEKIDSNIRTVLAQLVLDELYAMLKCAHGALDTTPNLRRLVRWVAESYNIYPRALLLKDIQLYSHDTCAVKASGGYGRVFHAKRQGCADVAVKCLFLAPPPPSGYDLLELTEQSKAKGNDSESVVVVEAGTHLQFREGITWSCLEHPNVLPFLGYHDIVIERTSGLGLVSPWRRQGHILAYVERLEGEGKKAPLAKLFRDIARGLTYLHDMSIAHGDLHAGNILITDDGVAQIADLGTAKYLDNSQYTANSIRRAQNMWNCPESTRCILQGYSYQLDPASDVYSFGCLWLQVGAWL
ncbi:kinase-like protein [Panus rudis PR-1116 ss-1]|nr:kinase-like protein [Panus rudis PR-1116 ss-1]